MQQTQLSPQSQQQQKCPQPPHLKAITTIKQVTQIRKITQQTLSPIIKNRVEQHIALLLAESTALRNQTSLLQQVQATNLQYKHEIEHMRERLHQVRTELQQTTQKHSLKEKDFEKKFMTLESDIQELTRQGKEKTEKIKKLTELNQTQTQLFDMAKDSMVSGMDLMKQEIVQFYDKEIKLNFRNQERFKVVDENVGGHLKRIEVLEKQIKEVKGVTAIYSSERQQIRTYLQQAIEMSHQAIRRQQYEKDRKFHKIQNELTKTHVEKVVNEALTPEIRKFLPTLIQNIELLKSIEKEIKQCAQHISQSKETQREMGEKILRFEYSTKKAIEEKQIEIKKLAMQLESKISPLNEELKALGEKLQLKFMQVQAVQRKTKQDNDHMFETFIDKNRTKIYLAVLQCKPPEVQEQQNRIKQKLNSFQDKMQEINKRANQRSDNVLNIGNTLDAKLQLFQNRITKAKSDLKVENENIKKTIETFNKKLQESQQKNHQQSQVISKLLEICLVNTSLQIDDEYLSINNGAKYGQENGNVESYISFHDGIIYEVTGDNRRNETFYRKKRLNKEILKRSLLNEQAKLIDFITQKLKSWKWSDPKERPSQFFLEKIYPGYESMMNDKKALIDARHSLDEKLPNMNFKLASSKLLSPSLRKSRQSILQPVDPSPRPSQLPSKHMSKPTIQEKRLSQNMSYEAPRGSSLAEKISETLNSNNQHSQLYTTIDFNKPNRIRLKKIDQREEGERLQQQGRRYSAVRQVNKHTIQ